MGEIGIHLDYKVVPFVQCQPKTLCIRASQAGFMFSVKSMHGSVLVGQLVSYNSRAVRRTVVNDPQVTGRQNLENLLGYGPEIFDLVVCRQDNENSAHSTPFTHTADEDSPAGRVPPARLRSTSILVRAWTNGELSRPYHVPVRIASRKVEASWNCGTSIYAVPYSEVVWESLPAPASSPLPPGKLQSRELKRSTAFPVGLRDVDVMAMALSCSSVILLPRTRSNGCGHTRYHPVPVFGR